MSVLKKLNEARRRFHATAIKKTGRNTFSNYDYFELGDFLVPALQIFDELQLSAVISFGVELASMTLTDLEDGSQFVITSPMSTAALKACHEVQNLGAVQTYLRRYLWVAALEIVEHDALDSVTGSDKGAPEKKQAADLNVLDKRYLGLTAQRAKVVRSVAAAVLQKFNEGDEWGAYVEASGLQDNDEKLALWSILSPHSDLRSALKRLAEEERANQKAAA